MKRILGGGDNKIMVRGFLPQPPNEALHTIVNSTVYYSQLPQYNCIYMYMLVNWSEKKQTTIH